MKNLKVLGLASLTAVCAFSLVSCGNTYHEKEKAAKEYMVAHPEQYGQFDLSGGKFSWELSTSAVASGCQYEISYNFKTDKGTLYVKDLTAKELTEFEATFTLTYDWDYDEAADTEKCCLFPGTGGKSPGGLSGDRNSGNGGDFWSGI